MNPHILVSVEHVTAPLLESLSAQQVGIELSCFANPHLLDSPDLDAAITKHRDLLAGFDLPITMHGAFYDLNPVARDPMILNVCRTRIRQSLDVARRLGIHKVVFHANYVHSNHTQYQQHWTEKQAAFWSEFIPALEAEG
ncbi:MAG TPA: TIM barrel protein, partial [Marmoricola sp.]|nr:TIM barrel protein [Marmoricola sp.]